MDLLWIIVIGAIVGWLGSLVAGRGLGLIVTILIGIVGTWLGFFIWGQVGGDSRAMGYVVAVLVAAGLVILASRMGSRRTRQI